MRRNLAPASIFAALLISAAVFAECDPVEWLSAQTGQLGVNSFAEDLAKVEH